MLLAFLWNFFSLQHFISPNPAPFNLLSSLCDLTAPLVIIYSMPYIDLLILNAVLLSALTSAITYFF